jgi:hypothetical protein
MLIALKYIAPMPIFFALPINHRYVDQPLQDSLHLPLVKQKASHG